MAGINLSQSAQERQDIDRGGVFDAGALWSLVIFLLVLGVWGGLRFYMGTLDEKAATLDVDLAKNQSSLQGPEASRVADFDTRLALLDKGLDAGVDPAGLFSQLEKLMIPSVILTGYEYNQEEDILSVSGYTDGFKSLAQQMTSFKMEVPFTGLWVESVGRTKEGKISFVFKTSLAKAGE